MNLDSLCVYCGSRPGEQPIFMKSAQRMGHALADEGIDLVYGGGAVGLMGAVADAVLERQGRVVGVLPEGLATREKAHLGLTKLHLVSSMHERKAKMAKLSQGFIALPGGLGTLEELCEVTTWAQLGIHQKPIGILNVDGFFDGFLAFLDHACQMGFLSDAHRRLLLVDDDPLSLLESMDRFQPYLERVWLDESQI